MFSSFVRHFIVNFQDRKTIQKIIVMKFIFGIMMTVLVAVALATPNGYNSNWKHGESSSHHDGSNSHEYSHGWSHGNPKGSHNLPGSSAVSGGKHFEQNSGNTQQPSNPVRMS